MKVKICSVAGVIGSSVMAQDGGSYPEYFERPTRGSVDAQTAALAAERIGVPAKISSSTVSKTTRDIRSVSMRRDMYVPE